MKVIYDISVLGFGHYNQQGRTGIARVIENLAVYMQRTNACDLSFCAYRSYAQLIQVYKCLKTMPELQNLTLHYTSSNILNIVARSLQHMYPDPSKKIIHRIIKRLLTPFHYNSIDISAMQSSDIFHATFYAIPGFVRHYQQIKRFITVYDLIPVLYPQFFSLRKDHMLHDVMKSITPDDWVIAISQSTKNDLCDYLKFDPERVFVTHLASSDLFYPCSDREKITQSRKKYGIPDAPYVLSLCTLEPRKNIDHTIRCFARMVQEQHISDLNLVLVGTKGWDFDKIFGEMSNYSQLKNRIIITGYAADEDLAAIYSGAMMFVYPSFYEGFGLPPLEAMKCGIPVITSNTSSLPEVVGDAGILVDPTDSETLCQSMYDIYRSSSRRESMATKSLERAKLFSWDKCARETVQAYKTALRS